MIHPHPSMEGKNVFHWQKKLRRAEFTPATFTTLFMLSTYAGRRGEECRPGVDLLMLDTGLSRNSVRTALRDGVNRGFLVQVSPGKWRGSAAVYNLALPRKGSTIDPFKVRKGSIHDPERGQPLTPTNSSTSRAAPGYALERSAEAAHQALTEAFAKIGRDTPSLVREDIQYELHAWAEPQDTIGEPVNIDAIQMLVSDTLVAEHIEDTNWQTPPERYEMFNYLVDRLKPHVDKTYDNKNKTENGAPRKPKEGVIELEYPFRHKDGEHLEILLTVPTNQFPPFLGSAQKWFDDLELEHTDVEDIE